MANHGRAVAPLVAGLLGGAATLAHAYVSLGSAATRCQAMADELATLHCQVDDLQAKLWAVERERETLREREVELTQVLDEEKEKSPIRREKIANLKRELAGAREESQHQMSERAALTGRVESLLQNLKLEQDQHARVSMQKRELEVRLEAVQSELCREKEIRSRVEDEQSELQAQLETVRSELCREKEIRSRVQEERESERQKMLGDMAARAEEALKTQEALKRDMLDEIEEKVLTFEREKIKISLEEARVREVMLADQQTKMEQLYTAELANVEKLKGEQAKQTEAWEAQRSVVAKEHQELKDRLAEARQEQDSLQACVLQRDTELARAVADLAAERSALEDTLEQHAKEKAAMVAALAQRDAELAQSGDAAAAEVLKLQKALEQEQHDHRQKQALFQEQFTMLEAGGAAAEASLRDAQAVLAKQVVALQEERDAARQQAEEARVSEKACIERARESGERSQTVIDGLMSDVAKADVAMKRARAQTEELAEAQRRERVAAEEQADALKQAVEQSAAERAALVAALEQAECRSSALQAERDAAVREAAGLRADLEATTHSWQSATTDADSVSEELVHLHNESARQQEHNAQLQQSAGRVARERDFLQEMLARSKKKHEADAAELSALKVEMEAWRRMASTRAPHTDAKHLQWLWQSLQGKKKAGTLDAVDEQALAAFDTHNASIFQRTSADGQDDDPLLMTAFHKTLTRLLVDGVNSPESSLPQTNSENRHPLLPASPLGKAVGKLTKTLADYQGASPAPNWTAPTSQSRIFGRPAANKVLLGLPQN